MTLALILIGILAILLTIFVWFTPWSENGVETHTKRLVSLGTSEFYTAIESVAHGVITPIPEAENIEILNNGDEFVPDLLQEIKGAEHSITLANYIWKEGALTNDLFDALTEKAKEGVEVRVLMDAKGSLKAPKDKIEALEKAGGRVAKFRPLGIRTITRLNKRSHLRAIAIDGKVGYTGGVAFDDEWLGDGTRPDEWRDMMIKMRGYGARAVQNMFADLWRQTTGEVLAGSDFYPPLPAIIVSDDCAGSCFIPLFHTPSPDVEKNLSDFLWLSIMGATDHIILETPYLLPNSDILNALKEKAADGVRVDIMVPGPYVDSRIVQVASRSYYAEILAAGIHLHEYQPAHLHSKIFSADGHWSIVGSANLDNRSSTLNIEGVFGIESAALARDLEKEFAIDKSRSVEVTQDNLTLGITDKLFGQVSRLFAKQY
ncbi:MAG: cardiolipin synthase [Parcubacteria group bacterium]|nr:cardiolipin synthase [Parcubacteria group bacterium]